MHTNIHIHARMRTHQTMYNRLLQCMHTDLQSCVCMHMNSSTYAGVLESVHAYAHAQPRTCTITSTFIHARSCIYDCILACEYYCIHDCNTHEHVYARF